MPMLRGLLRLTLALALAAGCASGGIRPETLQAWVGRPGGALEKDWGPPTREVQDGETRILVYEEVERKSTKSVFDDADPSRARGGYGMAQLTANEAYRSPTVYVRSYLFWVNREGTIVHSAVRTP